MTIESIAIRYSNYWTNSHETSPQHHIDSISLPVLRKHLEEDFAVWPTDLSRPFYLRCSATDPSACLWSDSTRPSEPSSAADSLTCSFPSSLYRRRTCFGLPSPNHDAAADLRVRKPRCFRKVLRRRVPWPWVCVRPWGRSRSSISVATRPLLSRSVSVSTMDFLSTIKTN